MNVAARIARSVWEFVAGDDWFTALGVVLALGLTAVVDPAAAWLVMPVAVSLLLAFSIWRGARQGPERH
jgi:hypothetical protein